MSDRLLSLVVRTQNRLTVGGSERGDVPGWVMITVMTAGIVTVLWGLASDSFKTLFDNAIKTAASPTKG